MLDYGDIIYRLAGKDALKRLDVLYHSAIRFATNAPYRSHHCTLYSSVNWSSPYTCCKTHWLTLVYKTLLGLTPPYLTVANVCTMFCAASMLYCYHAVLSCVAALLCCLRSRLSWCVFCPIFILYLFILIPGPRPRRTFGFWSSLIVNKNLFLTDLPS